MRNKKYDIIYSLGSNCACALYLNKNNLRATSGPFDWVSEISFKNRIDLILNNFTDYLKLSDLKKISHNSKPDTIKHEIYKNEKLGCVFPHDFELGIPIEKTHDKVLKKYQRRIDRFYNNIYQKEKVLLVWFSLDIHLEKDEILEASNALNKKFSKNIDILVIENDDRLLNKDMQIEYLNGTCTKINLFAKIINEQSDFSKGNVKLCNKIFKMYSLNKSLIENIRIVVVKLICCLIPIKKIRKQIRHILLYGKN